VDLSDFVLDTRYILDMYVVDSDTQIEKKSNPVQPTHVADSHKNYDSQVVLMASCPAAA